MKLEKLINKISSIAAVLVIYIVALSFYLGAKGFYIDSNHNIVLKAPEAIAAESPKTSLAKYFQPVIQQKVQVLEQGSGLLFVQK